MIRVGRRIYKDGEFKDPEYENFTPIVVMTKCTKYGSLSPYELKDDDDQIMENIWQFSKVYESVPHTRSTYSRYNNRVIWQWPAQEHLTPEGELNENYVQWRTAGFKCKDAVRYPVSFNWRNKCLFSLKDVSLENGIISSSKPLDYISARKEIYLPLYTKMVKTKDQFIQLKNMLLQGKNLLIIEVDGPHQESLDYYVDKYKVERDFIAKDTILATKKNMDIMLNDAKHPFGHGYCLAVALREDLTNPIEADVLLGLKSLAELKKICRDNGWKGWSKFAKPALVDFILERSTK